MATNLVIVESPAKAKTIEGFLGDSFKVLSSFGHVRDLASKGMGIDINKGFIPDYQISNDKKETVKILKKAVKDASIIWLATDEDREGEAIAWHLSEILKLEKKETKRIVFNEITKKAITKAVENPRTINYDLVNAQQARRVLDRLVGFELSPILWRKVKQGLSAGRVQSVAVRLIVEREREISVFVPESYFKVSAVFSNENGENFSAELSKKLNKISEVEKFLNECKNFTFNVKNLEFKPGKRKPSAPFTTSTLQQEAASKLGYSVAKTMTIAQKLYEAGKITYMRTDSVNLSDDAISSIGEYVVNNYGKEYSNPKSYVTKSKSAQEAHEAIRPTNISIKNASEDNFQQKLYNLIWKRTVSSQMSDAKLEKTKVTITNPNSNLNFISNGEVIVFDGFLRVILNKDESELASKNEDMLPKLTLKERLSYKKIFSRERFTQPPSRFSEASLVRKLEELGIGRPSTYVPTISTVLKRGYVEKGISDGKERKYEYIELIGSELTKSTLKENYGSLKGKLCPTDVGLVVNDFLVSNFDSILDYHFTASVEEEFDEIASGKKKWNQMLEKFYGDFHSKVEFVKENSERAIGEKLLGVDPKTGLSIYVKIGRYGPMVQLGHSKDDEKPKFASLKKGQSIQSISLNEAIELFKLPRKAGSFEEKSITIGIGRFGPYIYHDSKYISLKDHDPMSITFEECVEMIIEKRRLDASKKIHLFDKVEPIIEVLNGRWGPYIRMNKTNFKIPKETNVDNLSREDCILIIEKNDSKKKKSAKKSIKKS